MKYITHFIPCLFFTFANVQAQNYHAIHGSSYAGALGVANNPASIVNVSDVWDINPLSLQYETSTNAVRVLNYSLLSSPQNSKYWITNGEFGRYASGNFNLHLFNTRIALDRRHAFAVGMNLKGYLQGKTATYNFLDSVNSIRSFLNINEVNRTIEGKIRSSSWLEVFGTYSQTIWDNETSRLNAGISLKGMRGIAAAFAGLQRVGFARSVQNNQRIYFLKNGDADYAYSANLDRWKTSQSTSQNIQDVVVSSEGSISVDLGIEYLIKEQRVSNYYDEDNYFEYDWKIGISLLDIGRNHYKYSAQSRSVGSAKENISDRMVEGKFDASDIPSFNDSLTSIFNRVQALSGVFSVINPARLVLNVDRSLYNNFYVNGELSVNLSSLTGKEKLYVTHLNVLTLTPRWETRRYGLYLPVQLNTEKQFWIGMAFKAGPLLLGVHNLANVFARDKIQNGGAYIAFIVRPGHQTRSPRDKRNECPD